MSRDGGETRAPPGRRKGLVPAGHSSHTCKVSVRREKASLVQGPAGDMSAEAHKEGRGLADFGAGKGEDRP